MPEDQAPVGVGLRVVLLGLHETHLAVRLQDLAHKFGADFEVSVFMDLVTDQIRVIDRLT